MAAAVLAVACLHAILPPELRLQASGYLPWISVLMLVVLFLLDPGRIARTGTVVRVITDALIGLLTLSNAYAAAMLVVGIVDNESFADARTLLYAGASVWVNNVILFALWFWQLDRGGPAERGRGGGSSPAFVFPEMQHSQHVAPGWTPAFVDYLSYSFATATAFSPTDVSAIKPWAKLLVIAESLISLGLATLVIARAINVIA